MVFFWWRFPAYVAKRRRTRGTGPFLDPLMKNKKPSNRTQPRAWSPVLKLSLYLSYKCPQNRLTSTPAESSFTPATSQPEALNIQVQEHAQVPSQLSPIQKFAAR
jgi:hypothetical protein